MSMYVLESSAAWFSWNISAWMHSILKKSQIKMASEQEDEDGLGKTMDSKISKMDFLIIN